MYLTYVITQLFTLFGVVKKLNYYLKKEEKSQKTKSNLVPRNCP